MKRVLKQQLKQEARRAHKQELLMSFGKKQLKDSNK